MNKRIEYSNAYKSKRLPEGVYVMNEFCSSIHNSADVDDIPDILKLYYDDVDTLAQNEFITEVLNEIVQKKPREATKKIMANIMILREEEAEECIYHVLMIFIYWNHQFRDIFVDELKKADKDSQAFIIDTIKYFAEKGDKSYLEFSEQYKKIL